MNGRLARKIRKEARAEAMKRDAIVLPKLKEFINGLNFPNRLKIAFNIIRRKF